MAKGENIFKRKDGRWEARYIRGYELSGKIKYGFCYGKTYKEAKEKVTQCNLNSRKINQRIFFLMIMFKIIFVLWHAQNFLTTCRMRCMC